MKFTTKLLFLSLGSLLSVAVSLSLLLSYAASQALDKEVRARLQERAGQTIDKLERMLFERHTDIHLMASRINESNLVTDSPAQQVTKITQLLLDHRQHYKFYYSLSYYNANRIRVADTAGFSIGQSAEESQWSRAVFTQGINSISSDIHNDPDLQKTVIYFAVPIKDRTGVVSGAVVARMPAENLYYVLSNMEAENQSSQVELFNTQGELLYSTTARQSIGKTVLTAVTSEQLAARFGKEMLYTIAQEQGYLGFAGNNWTLVAYSPRDEALAPVIKLRNTAFAIGFTLILLFGGITLFSARRIVKPILLLKAAALKLGHGEFDTTVPVVSQDELGELAATFNQMAQLLAQNMTHLKQQEQFLRLVIDNIPQMIFWKDTKSCYLGCNKKVLEMNGLTSFTEIVGKTDFELVWHHWADQYRQDDQRVMVNNRPELHIIEPILEINKNCRWVDVNKIPLQDVQGQVIGVLGTAEDITERKQAEELLKDYNQKLEHEVLTQTEELAAANEELQVQTEELLANNQLLEGEIIKRQHIEEVLIQAKETAELAKAQADVANQAKSNFLSNMSHELRTPLNGILGYAQILARDTTLTPKQHNGIDVIQRSGEYLLQLINDILDLAKIEAGKIELFPTDLNFDQFIQTITELFQIRAQQKGIAFLYEPLTQLPLGVRGDEKRLRQILINLLGNAVKFTDQGGVTLKIGYHEGKVRFQIEDTGVGIAPADKEKIFQPFQQVGNSIAHKAEGTGLGLSITKRLIEMMGAQLQVESVLGQGSTFWFMLELPEISDLIPSHAHRDATIIGFAGSARKILVVDDKWENRSVMVQLLTPLGFEVMEANDGQEALTKAIETPPDLILMDLVMPMMDGFEATRQLRATPGLETIPIIAASANVFDYHQEQSRIAGCNDFIAKPFRTEVLFQLLQKYLNLTWNYNTSPPPIATSPEEINHTSSQLEMIWPTPKQAAELYDLAMMGDIGGILEKVEELEMEHPQLKPFLAKIHHLAAGFQEQQLCEMLGQYVT